LWDLYQIDRELSTCEENITEKKERKQRKLDKKEVKEVKVKELRRQLTSLQAEANDLERGLNDLKAELDGKRLPLIRIRDATKSLNERISIKSARLEKTEKEARESKNEIDETKIRLSDLEEKYQQFVKEFETEETTDNLACLPIQQKEE